MQKLRYLAVDVRIPAGSNGTITHPVELDPAYNYCNGIAVYEKSNGGISGYNIALADDQKVFHDFTDSKDWMPGTNVAPDERYKSIDIENAKQRFKIRIDLDAQLVSELRFQVVFRLINA